MVALRAALKPVLLEYLLGRIDTEQAITKILEVIALHGRLILYE